MHECFQAITLALWVYVLIPFYGIWGYYKVKDKLDERRERKRINELIEAEKAEIQRLHTEYRQ